MSWHLIADAPTDRAVLLWIPRRHPSVVVGEYWQVDGLAWGWWAGSQLVIPTHWMALPEAPACGQLPSPSTTDARSAMMEHWKYSGLPPVERYNEAVDRANELLDDHSVTLQFVREIARDHHCLRYAAPGCVCIVCRARVWLHTEKLEGPAGGARGEADARARDAGTPQSTGTIDTGELSTPSVSYLQRRYRLDYFNAQQLSNYLVAIRADRDQWHSQAHLLATELEAERGKRWCRCGDDASVCAICATLPTEHWR
jgi:hypothetical protein